MLIVHHNFSPHENCIFLELCQNEDTFYIKLVALDEIYKFFVLKFFI
jgi:hypothetical protein